MVYQSSAANALGWAGTVISLFFIFLPVFMMYNMYKTKDTSRVTYLLFIVSLVNSFFWFIYGFIVFAYPIIVPNGISITVNMIYLICFFVFLDFTLVNRLLMIFGLVLIVSISVFIGLYFLSFWDTKIFGIITIIVNCLVFIGPIQKIVQTFKERDWSFIPIEIVIALILNSIIWVAYGICLNMDINIIIPNIFGGVLMVLELFVWCYFYFTRDQNYSYKKNDEQKNSQYGSDGNGNEDEDTINTEEKPLII